MVFLNLSIQKIRVLISALLLLVVFSANAQNQGIVEFTVLSRDTQIPIGGANITLGKRVGIADENGQYIFQNVEADTLQILVRSIGSENYTDTIVKNNFEDLRITILMNPQIDSIVTVQILGQSTQRIRSQAPIRAIIVDARSVSNQAISLSDLMNRNTGVKIRQSGGMGSKPEISINGFQGKSIKYFRDGIPLENRGEGYNLSVFPLEILNHVEVYKGVLPVSLGADALGGAINLVTLPQWGSQTRVFYELGSFHTQRLGLTTSHTNSSNTLSYGAEVFFNRSENDYKAEVEVVDPETKNKFPETLPFFHNAYQQLLGEAYVSILNRSWANELKFSLMGFDYYKEQQHPALMTDPYGGIHNKQRSVSPSLRYRNTFFDNRLRVDQYVSYNKMETQRIDTLQGFYDWYGNFFPSQQRGESRIASQSRVNENNYTSRSYLSYQLTEAAKIDFNYVFTASDLKGNDSYGTKLGDIDVLSLPSSFQKHVAGVSYEHYLLNGKLQNQLMGKYYAYNTSGYQNTWLAVELSENDFRNVSGNYWGVTEALKWVLDPTTFVRASAEYTYRLPERDELFGNYVFVVPNFELKPERSMNVNLGFQTDKIKNLQLEINGFYRNTQGMILLIPIQSPNAQYQNQENVQGGGVDLDVKYTISPNYLVSANATWQDLRLFGIENEQNKWKNGARLRNTPYFFANLGAQAKYRKVFMEYDFLQLFLHYNFMREFYLETIPQNLEAGGFLGLSGSANLNSNLIIPNQHTVQMGFLYNFSPPLALGGEIRNVLDNQVYDFYRIQKPGRSFHVKMSYKFNINKFL